MSWISIYEKLPEDVILEFDKDNPDVFYTVKDSQGVEWVANLKYLPVTMKTGTSITHWKNHE